MKRLFIVALSIGVSMVMALPVGSSSDIPKRGGTLTMAIRKDLTVMNPLVRTSSTDRSIRDLMFESLLILDENGTIRPNLAESWKVSQDGKLYTFELRKGVKFHNGQEMTSQDNELPRSKLRGIRRA